MDEDGKLSMTETEKIERLKIIRSERKKELLASEPTHILFRTREKVLERDDYLLLEADEIMNELDIENGMPRRPSEDEEMEAFERHAESLVRFAAGKEHQGSAM
jgi:hypothetical protein